MKLSKEALKEFKDIYFEEYGKKLNEEETQEKASKLLVLMKAIYKPLPVENKNKNERSLRI
jgi:hypothetical protein